MRLSRDSLLHKLCLHALPEEIAFQTGLESRIIVSLWHAGKSIEIGERGSVQQIGGRISAMGAVRDALMKVALLTVSFVLVGGEQKWRSSPVHGGCFCSLSGLRLPSSSSSRRRITVFPEQWTYAGIYPLCLPLCLFGLPCPFCSWCASCREACVCSSRLEER